MLDKSIESGREHRRKYHGPKLRDNTCRNHGSCKWCEHNRTFNSRKRLSAADDDLRGTVKAHED